MNNIVNIIIDKQLIKKILSKYYTNYIDISNNNIISLILNKVLITKKLSTLYLDIFLNISDELLNLINEEQFIFYRDNKYGKKYHIKYNIKCYNKKVRET